MPEYDLLLMRSPSLFILTSLIQALLDMPCSTNIHVSHVSTSYWGSPLVQSLNTFALVSGDPQQNTSGFGKSGWNEHQVIPGNLQKFVSTNRSLLQCKTLPAHFSNNMMVYCLLNVIYKQDEWRLCLQKSLEQYSECL